MSKPEITGEKQATTFKPGQSGNPLGRPKGARSKLGEVFIKAMLDDFEINGVAAISEVRETKPDQYLKVVASILPKEITGEDGEPLKSLLVLSDEALAAIALSRG